VAKAKAKADELRAKKEVVLKGFLELGVAISERGWFGDSQKRLKQMDRELEQIEREIEETGQ